MSLKVALLLPPLLACVLAVAGCQRAGSDSAGIGAGGVAAETGGDVDALVSELKTFTDELLRQVESAPDPRAGVAEAQRLLDARRAALAAGVAAVRQGQKSRQDAAARRKWLEAEVDNTDRVSRLQVKYLDASMRDPEFKARLDKLVGDYNSLFKEQ
jgi:hypothetical protein